MAMAIALKRSSTLAINNLLRPLVANAPRSFSTQTRDYEDDDDDETRRTRAAHSASRVYPYSYILATHQLQVGSKVFNCDFSKSKSKSNSQSAFLNPNSTASHRSLDLLDLNSQIGTCIPLADMRIGTWVHSIECNPGQGAKLVRSAGTFAKILKEPGQTCLLRLPSGDEKLIDSRCRATVGVVSNPTHGSRKLRKAGQKRWLGRRPVVRGVAMNPVDHPHGGGEGRTKGGRPSVSPWGKPTKAGYRTGAVKRRN